MQAVKQIAFMGDKERFEEMKKIKPNIRSILNERKR